MTDAEACYKRGVGFDRHEIVSHYAGEDVRGDARTPGRRAGHHRDNWRAAPVTVYNRTVSLLEAMIPDG